MKRLLCAAFIMLAYTIIHAENESVSIHTFGDSDGFRHNKVTGICQDQRGFVWMSSWNGLYRYDGARFIAFCPTLCESSTNGDDRFDEARIDAFGNVWCRSYHHPYMFDVRKSTFIDIGREIKKRIGSTPEIKRIICKGNDVWLQSQDCIAIHCTAGNKQAPMIFSPTSKWRLCGGQVTSIKVDSYGHTWIISERGITITDCGSSPGKKKLFHIPGSFISMEEGPKGKHYIVAKNGTVKTVDGIKRGIPLANCTPRLRNVTLPAGWTIQRSISHDDGEIALATSSGILICRKGKWTVIRYASGVGKTLRIKRDNHGRYWVVTDKPGIILADPAKQTARHLLPPTKGAYKNKRDSWFFHSLPNGNIVLMAQNDGLCMYDNATQQLERITRTDGKLYQPQVGRSFIDSENNLWLFNEPNDIERLSSCNQTINHRADGSATRFLYRDNRQRIWRSTDNDRLMIYDIHGKLSGYVSTNGSISRTLASFPTVYSMAETKNGFVWIGTKNKGLYCFMPKDNGGFDVRHYHSEGGKHSYLPADDIFSLATDHEGRLWVGTYSQGLFLLENPPVPYATFRKVQGFPSDFRSNNIRALLCLHNGLMAVGTSNGLITFATDPRNPSVVKAFHNRRGNNKPNSLCNNVIMSLFEDSRKRLYIVSPTSGICHTASANLLSDSIPFTTIATRNGAPSDMPLAISEDKQNRLWIAYTNSISCLQKDRKAFGNRPFPCDNENSLLSASSIVTLANDTMMTGTNNGIALWDISTRSKTAMPRIAVTELSVCGSPRNTDFDFTDTLKLSSAERDITMTISALLPSGNKYVRYASRADITSRWTIHGNNAQLSLMNLNAGWHRLQIKSTDNTGAWTDNVRTLHIHVQPTFWETPWATLMYILLLALVIGTAAGVWAYIYHLRVKLRTRMENIKMRVDFINNVAPELQKAEDNILECVRLYVNSRIDDEKLSVPEIAGHVGMSVAAFRARFKQLTGVSPVDYLRHYRIECAKNLLLTTNMTVSEVAYRCGFSDPKYFSRVFKAVEGVSPSAFKDNTH